MKKTTTIIFTLILFSIALVSSNLVCGEIKNSEENSASWRDVSVYYQENPSFKTTCKTNSQNKFCCDLEQINQVSFSPGKIVIAEFFDGESAISAGPVSLITTQDGYTVFPEMQIEEVIKISNSSSKIIFENKAYINLTMSKDFSNLKIISDNYEEDICYNCTSAEVELELSHGKNEFQLISTSAEKIAVKKISFYFLKFLDIKKTITCNECKKNVPANKIVQVNIFVNSSYPISEEVIEYFPVQWETDENYHPYSDSHNQIIFFMNESQQEFSYKVKSPNDFRARQYQFITEIGGHRHIHEVTLYKFLKIFKIKYDFNKKFQIPLRYNIKPDMPLIIYDETGPISMISIFPKKEIQNANANIKYENKNKIVNLKIHSNINKNQIEKILIRSEKNLNIISDGKEIQMSPSPHAKGFYDAYVTDLKFSFTHNIIND
jgi:hypothetical protein